MVPNTEVTFYACACKQSHHEVVTEKSVSAVCETKDLFSTKCCVLSLETYLNKSKIKVKLCGLSFLHNMKYSQYIGFLEHMNIAMFNYGAPKKLTD